MTKPKIKKPTAKTASKAKKPAPKSAKLPKAKKAPKPAAAKKRGKATEAAPAAEPTPTFIAPTQAPVVLTPEESVIAGEAINGTHLSRCIRYAAKVCPKEDGELFFTHDAEGNALVSAHDLTRSHTGFLVKGAAMHCDIAVPRDEAIEFANLIDGLSGPLVRIDAAGNAVVRHGVAQSPIRFALGERAITQRWQPPSQAGRDPAVGPLRLSASAQKAAVNWPAAVVHEHQSASGIAWLNVSDAETGTLLARAVLAEDGKDLYAADERQTEIPGSRTVGGEAGGLRGAVQKLKDMVAEHGGSISVVEGGVSTELFSAPSPTAEEVPADGEVTITAGGESVTVGAEDAPAPAASPSPSPVRPVVIEVPEALWDELPEVVRAQLRTPVATQVWWFNGREVVTSSSLAAIDASAVSAILEGNGLKVAASEPATRHGADVDLWTIARAEGVN